MNFLNRRNDNWIPLVDFRPEMDSLFDDFFSPTLRNLLEQSSVWTPACDIGGGGS